MKRIISALLLFSSAYSCVAEDTTSVNLGTFYISGSYGADTDTTMRYVPLTVSYRTNALKLSATTSYLYIDGASGGSAGIVDGNGALPPSGHAEGFGDILLKASYDVFTESRRSLLRPQLKIKIPTADESKGLGTGATDYTMQFDAFYFVNGWWPYVSVGYRWRGDGSYVADDGMHQRYPIDTQDGLIAGAGFFKPLTTASSLTVSYEHREPSYADLAATEEALATYQYRFDSRWLAAFSVGTGFTTRSADQIVGLQIEFRY